MKYNHNAVAKSFDRFFPPRFVDFPALFVKN